jgi:teichuronic acid biosynthesis glycosyltransferase TuaC
MPPAPLRVLTFSTLYPNAAAPNHGVFVENRLRHLVATGEVTATVLAPVPWFPSTDPRFGVWARYAKAPQTEQRAGLTVLHPRFPAIPRFGMSVSPFLLYLAAARALTKLRRAGQSFDLIDAHYFYPDGVAAVWLARRFGLPVVVTARGSDITQFPDHAVPRALIRRAARQADAVITVSDGLRRALLPLGVPDSHITALRNGVDLAIFYPRNRDAARAAFGLTGPTLLSVGALIERKGHHLTIEALAELPGWQLLIAGEGPEHAALKALASRLGVAGRVRLLGAVPHADLPPLYSAADISLLSSSREGWANVLLESMACGTPVVASPIPGNDEVVRERRAGVIAGSRTAGAIADAVRDLAATLPTRADTAAYAGGYGWDSTSQGQLALFRAVIEASRSANSGGGRKE